MRIDTNYVLQEVAGEYIVVPIGEAAYRLNGVIKLNETGAFIWKKLSQKSQTEEELVEAIVSEFKEKKDIVQADIKKYLDILNNFGCIV